MKTIVVYYSKTGSNEFLAYKIKESLSAHIEELRPRINSQILLMLGLGLGLKKTNHKISDFDRVILCGPIWMGKFVYPLKTFVKKYQNEIIELVFVTCCGSSYEMKEKKFGHGLVFNEIESILKEKCILCQALPIALVLPEDKKEDPDATMKTRLTDENFKGEIQEQFDAFINKLSEMNK